MFGVASSTQAQQVQYFTTGQFSGAACASPNTSPAVCAASGLTLTFTGTTVGPIPPFFPPSVADFGSFFLTSVAPSDVNVTGGSVNFTLFIHQTQPTAGTVSTIGSITGTVQATSSSLFWKPNQTQFFVGNIEYDLSLDTTKPALGAGINIPLNRASNIRGFVDVVASPEPGSIALFATGLAGLIPVAIRRRKSSK